MPTYSARHAVDSVFVNTRRARWRGDDWGADIKGDVCATRNTPRKFGAEWIATPFS